jgi:Protein of unknown function (DUF1186)/SEC-C motif
MDIEEILSKLERNVGVFPTEAVQQAVARPYEITPFLLKALEDVAADPERYADDEDRMLHIYAILLLAQFREPRAYPLLVRIFSMPGDMVFDLFSDSVTDYLDRCLAAVSGGHLEGIRSLAENEKAHEDVRAAAIDALLILVATGERTRDNVMAYFLSLFRKLKRRPGLVWNCLVNACADLWPSEAMVEIRKAYKMGLVDESYISLGDIDEQLNEGKEQTLWNLKQEYGAVIDTVEELSDWDCFHRNERVPVPEEVRSSAPKLDRPKPDPVRRLPSVGRNDPCLCGSGKKFKKCCGQ